MTPMLFGLLLVVFAVGLGTGIVVGMRIRSQRILDAALERELAPAALPAGVATRTAVTRAIRRRADAAKAAKKHTAGGAA